MELVSVSEAAGIKGCTKQNISKRLKALQEAGRIATERRGRELVFSLAEFDAATGEVSDPARVVAQQTTKAVRSPIGGALDRAVDENLAGGGEPADPTYTQALTRKALLEGDRREIEIRQQRGELLPIDDVRQAMERCAEAIVRDVDQIPAFAEDIAAAMTRNGVAGVREVLKAKARELRATLARSMSLIATPEDEEETDQAEAA